MKSFSKDQIDWWRGEFVRRDYTQKIANLDNRSIDFFVLPTALFQGIPNGLFRMTGKREDGYLVGVSDEVPEIIQQYFALSEHDEFMVYGLEDEDRTLHSEQNIVRLLEESSLKPDYVEKKIALYDHMLNFSKGNLSAWEFSEEDYNGFERAANYLKGIK